MNGVKHMQINYDDITRAAIKLGFSAAAVMDTGNLVFKPEYRVFCEENQCGNYNLNPACPPESGRCSTPPSRSSSPSWFFPKTPAMKMWKPA